MQAFRNSAAKDRLKSNPTYEDLMKVVNKESRFANESDKTTQVKAMGERRRAWEGQRALKGVSSADIWKKGGYGHMKDSKPDDCVRILLENYNNLQYFTDDKIRHKSTQLTVHDADSKQTSLQE